MMTDKERLEEIKEDVFKCNHGDTRGYSYEQLYHIALSLVRNHGEWLIEQTERVQELEEENKRYREALEFYANEENYFFDEKEYKVGLGVPESEITIDYGNKARKALEGEE